MDVHAPHHSIGGWKDFFVHLVTITVGLLIAAGIEGCVELHREHKLVREARETMREEIRAQLRPDEEHAGRSWKQAESAVMKKNIETLTRIQENPKRVRRRRRTRQISGELLHGWAEGNGMEDGADDWGVVDLCRMRRRSATPMFTARRKNFLDQQDKILEDETQFFGVMAKTNFWPRGCHCRRNRLVAGAGTVRNLAGTFALLRHNGASDCGNMTSAFWRESRGRT